jgi:hypothetical protein
LYTKGPSSAQVAGRTAKGIAGEESSGPDSSSQFGPGCFQEEVSRKNEKQLANGSSRWYNIYIVITSDCNELPIDQYCIKGLKIDENG